MDEIKIRQFRKGDEEGILDICYSTGFMGEDLSGTGRFKDRWLFGLLFCLYYPWYESRNCYVASDGDRIAGYVIGTENSKLQKARSIFYMGYRIVFRLLFYTSMVYPESFKSVVEFLRKANLSELPGRLTDEYPAHLHINILPEYQHMGIGSRLIDTFEKHVKNLGVSGVHLVTSSRNMRAVPFYMKMGYRVLCEKDGGIWDGVECVKTMIFVKKL